MPADRCEMADYHSPHPLRFGWMLLQPAAALGQNIPSNRVQVCAGCADSVALLLWQIANGGVTVHRANPRHLAAAQVGYAACEAVNSTGMIPAEPEGLLRE